MGSSLFSPLFAPSVVLLAFLSCHPAIPIVVLFDPCFLGLFQAYCMLFFHLIAVTQHRHWVCIHATWASFSHSIAYGLPRPISSSLGILGLLLLSLGSFRPVCFLQGPFIILWAYDPLFLPFGLNGFFSQFTNSFLSILLGFFLLLGFSKMSINKLLLF